MFDVQKSYRKNTDNGCPAYFVKRTLGVASPENISVRMSLVNAKEKEAVRCLSLFKGAESSGWIILRQNLLYGFPVYLIKNWRTNYGGKQGDFSR